MKSIQRSLSQFVRRGFMMASICLALMAASGFCTGADAEPIELKLTKGQTLKWNLRLWKRTSAPDKPATEGGSTTPVTLKVLDKTADGYVVELQHGHSDISATGAADADKAPEVQALRAALEGIKVKVLLSNEGTFGDIVNFEEVRAAGLKVVDIINKSQVAAGRSDQGAFLTQSFSSKEGVATMFLKDVPLLFMAVGFDPASEEPMEFETELPNIFGGAPLKARGVVAAKKPRAEGLAEFDVEQEVDKESFAAMMNDIGKKVGKPVPSGTFEELMKKGGIKDTFHLAIELQTGLAYAALFRRQMVIEGGGSETLTEFTRVRE